MDLKKEISIARMAAEEAGKVLKEMFREEMTVTKKDRELEQSIPPEKYLQPGGFPNRACFRENIDQALNIARPEVIF